MIEERFVGIYLRKTFSESGNTRYLVMEAEFGSFLESDPSDHWRVSFLPWNMRQVFVRAQAHYELDTKEWREPYGNVLSIRECGFDDAKAALSFLQTIQKKLTSMDQKYGTAETFADFMQRFALASGVKYYVWADRLRKEHVACNSYTTLRDSIRYTVQAWKAKIIGEIATKEGVAS